MARFYGIRHSSRTNEQMWGKNAFNSCFPVSLLIWMADNNIHLVKVSSYPRQDGDGFDILNEAVSVAEILGADVPSGGDFYAFEHSFDRFNHLMVDGDLNDRADVVVADP